MNGDLISREALKKALKSNCDLCHDKNTNQCENCCPHNDFEDLIDNAPAVDTTCPHCDSGYAQGYSDGYLKDKDERPQDEWIDHSEDGYVECPICEHLTTCEDNIDELHYCWNCGAKMQKRGAE